MAADDKDHILYLTLIRKHVKSLINLLKKTQNHINSSRDIKSLRKYAYINIFHEDPNSRILERFESDINKLIKQKLISSPKSPEVLTLQEALVQNSGQFVTKLGESIREDALKIIEKGLNDEVFHSKIQTELVHKLKISEARAETIVRTEVMRAASTSEYMKQKLKGAMYYTLQCRVEACTFCLQKVGELYDIQDTKHIPPLHPRCACYVVYAYNKNKGVEHASDIHSQIWKDRQKLEKSGEYIIPDDGTGSKLNR